MSWVELSTSEKLAYLERLKLEVGRNHRLFGKLDAAVITAARDDSDDILVDVPGEDTAYVVHLVLGEETPEPVPDFPWASPVNLADRAEILTSIAGKGDTK